MDRDYAGSTAAVGRAIGPNPNHQIAGPTTRIHHDIDRLQTITKTLDHAAARIMSHARTMGYFEPPKESASNGIAPVVTTLADAIQDLERAANYVSGSLNVFD